MDDYGNYEYDGMGEAAYHARPVAHQQVYVHPTTQRVQVHPAARQQVYVHPTTQQVYVHAVPPPGPQARAQAQAQARAAAMARAQAQAAVAAARQQHHAAVVAKFVAQRQHAYAQLVQAQALARAADRDLTWARAQR